MPDSAVRAAKPKSSAPPISPRSKAKSEKAGKGSTDTRSAASADRRTEKNGATKAKKHGDPNKAHGLMALSNVSGPGAVTPLFGPQTTAPSIASSLAGGVDALSKGAAQLGHLFRPPAEPGLQAAVTHQSANSNGPSKERTDSSNVVQNPSTSSMGTFGETSRFSKRKPTKKINNDTVNVKPVVLRSMNRNVQREWNDLEFDLVAKTEALRWAGRGANSKPLVNEMVDLHKRRIDLMRTQLQEYLDKYNKNELQSYPRPMDVTIVLGLLKLAETGYKEFRSSRGLKSDKLPGMDSYGYQKLFDDFLLKHIDGYANAIRLRSNIQLQKYSPKTNPAELRAKLEAAMTAFRDHLNQGDSPADPNVQKTFSQLTNANYQFAAMNYLNEATTGKSPDKLQKAFNTYLTFVRSYLFKGEIANYKRQEQHDRGLKVAH